LGGALLLFGHNDHQVQAFFTDLFTSAKPANAPAVVAGGSTLTTRNVPAMIVYGLLYVGLSVLTLHFALADRRKTRIVLLAYGAVFVLIGGLLVLGKVLGMGATFTPFARDLIDGGGVGGGILSPLPVLLGIAIARLAPRGQPVL
ncbi:MAG: hypothetical protein H7330_04600, partial [Hymenobacteraceae bacterium]|nr:hypothetical protein [Hymenobacteraceae bacterium]